MSEGTLHKATDGPPDWAAIEADAFCPLCDYNLRGLTEPRCPECGFRFDWPDILDPARRLHPYIFEHHPERNFRSFWQTAFAGWRPRRFWTSLHPAQPSRPRRLILYWCLAASVVPLTCLATFLFLTHKTVQVHAASNRSLLAYVNGPARVRYQSFISAHYGTAQAYADSMYPPGYWANARTIVESEDSLKNLLFAPLCILSWAWLTFFTLLIFQVSMRRARVKTVHVLRCVLYSSDVLLWLGLIMLAMTPMRVWALMGQPRWGSLTIIVSAGLITLAIGVAACRLGLAYRFYLRFDTPFGTVLASQAVVILVLLNAVIGSMILGR